MLEEKQVLASFFEGINCSMQVLGDLAPRLGLEKETAYKLAAAFGGGLEQDGPCGAVSGALMALGLARGFYKPGDAAGKADFLAQKREFERRFTEHFPGLSCQEILGLDYRTAEGKRQMLEQGMPQKLCAPACCVAVEIIEDMLELD